jgi:hypothetical protein
MHPVHTFQPCFLKIQKVNDVAIKEQYQNEITNRFAALENMDDGDVENQ